MKVKRKQAFKIIIGIVAFSIIIVFYGCQQIFEKDLESKLTNFVTDLNKRTPIQIDTYSKLDSASLIEGKANLIFYYTLMEKDEFEVNYDSLNKYIRSIIIKDIKSPELKIFRENEITIDYEYYDKNGDFITELLVTSKKE